MKPMIDCAPLKMNPYDIFSPKKLNVDLLRANYIDRENKALLKKINWIKRNGGLVDSVNPLVYAKNYYKWHAHQKEMKEFSEWNQCLYKVLSFVKGEYDNAELEKWYKSYIKLLKLKCKFELVIGKPIDYDKILNTAPSISSMIDKVAGEKSSEKTQCFMNFTLSDGKYLGKIVIELYKDFVPVTCQNFLELCKGEEGLSYKGCLVHRIVKGQFIETGDITHNTGRGGMSVYGNTFHEEKHVLSHTRIGVLSMKRISYSENNSQFIISLGPLQKYDKMYVVFGKIVKGIAVLLKIQDYGRPIGKPYANIIISNCGVIERAEEKSNTKLSENGD